MAWVLRSPQIHSAFGSLGQVKPDGYHANENCDTALETILNNILTEDKYLRSYRRNISVAKIIEKDLIPMLLHVKEDKTIELLLRILVHLTIPVECLLAVDVISATRTGSETVHEINNLLTAAKIAFADNKATKVLIDFLKKNVGSGNGKLSTEQCTNISNVLLLLMNVLHIPEYAPGGSPNTGGLRSVQNQILWNIFSESIDKVLIRLMTIPEASQWPVTMVQLIALLYKDQHVTTLHRLLTLWHESSNSESSEDNESNTSNRDKGSEDSSLILTSDRTSDSSETGSEKRVDEADTVDSANGESNDAFVAPGPTHVEAKSPSQGKDVLQKDETTSSYESADNVKGTTFVGNKSQYDVAGAEQALIRRPKKMVISETSDCGYGTFVETRQYISTSSNEDDSPFKKPVHQKPRKATSTRNVRTTRTVVLDKKRKKIVKRGKPNITMNIQIQGLARKSPSDDDISNILKEFTIDFLMNGYNSLVRTLHTHILTNADLKMDTSHFFWLVTYFLKFATQIELDWENISSVLKFEVISYLTAEGVNLCEHFELAIKLDKKDLNPTSRKLHLVVTAIRECLQAIEAYEKLPYICDKGRQFFADLGDKLIRNEELHSLFVLLLRHYNQKYYTKQYLQDLIMTNHKLLTFLDRVTKIHKPTNVHSLKEHMRQFSSREVMHPYGLLLEQYMENEELVNDCIFTLMHHVGGELDSLISLFQPQLLTTFIGIWKAELPLCDDWSDLIEYVINTFIKKPQTLHSLSEIRLETQCFEDMEQEPSDTAERQQSPDGNDSDSQHDNVSNNNGHCDQGRWTEKELSCLTWNYMRCSNPPDVVAELIEMLKETGIMKTRDEVISELYRQNLVNQDEYKTLSRSGSVNKPKNALLTKETRDDEIRKLCDQLRLDEKSKGLEWLQKVLLEACMAKIYFEKKAAKTKGEKVNVDSKILGDNLDELPVISSVAWLALLYNQSVPLVPWNCEQAAINKDLKFLQLAHKLGFHMPVDTGKVFIRIPNFWTSEFLYDVATKISPVDTAKLKFSVSDLSGSAPMPHDHEHVSMTSMLHSDHQVKKPAFTTMSTTTPRPGSAVADTNETSRNWLEIIKRSRKTTLEHGTTSATATVEANEELKRPLKPCFVPPDQLPARSRASLHVDCGDSCCETVSVASDLTRMYVSDEEDRAEGRLAARRLPQRRSVDGDGASAEKRPRMHSAMTY